MPRVFVNEKNGSELSLRSYLRVCRDRDIPWSERSAHDHRDIVWASHSKAKCFRKTHEAAKAGRWNQFHDRHASMKGDRTVMAIPMVSIGIRKGWGSFDKSPLKSCYLDNYAHIDAEGPRFDCDAVDEAPPEASAAAAPCAAGRPGSSNDAVATPKGVKHSNADVAKVRLQHNNTLNFAAHVLLNGVKLRRLDAVTFVHRKSSKSSSYVFPVKHSWGNLISGRTWHSAAGRPLWAQHGKPYVRRKLLAIVA